MNSIIKHSCIADRERCISSCGSPVPREGLAPGFCHFRRKNIKRNVNLTPFGFLANCQRNLGGFRVRITVDTACQHVNSQILLMNLGAPHAACQHDTVLGEQGVHERVPDLSKFLLGFILRLRARPFDQPADDRILRKLLGCVVEEIRFWHCVGAFALANCKCRLKFPLSGGSVISRNYRSNPPY